MAGKMPRWLMGCGIGCGVVVVLVLAAITVGAVSLNRMLGDVDRATEMRAEIDERFDTAENFTPAADGSVAPDRLERFSAQRRASVRSSSDSTWSPARLAYCSTIAR